MNCYRTTQKLHTEAADKLRRHYEYIDEANLARMDKDDEMVKYYEGIAGQYLREYHLIMDKITGDDYVRVGSLATI